MRIVFRTDASIRIGTGHVMRCLTLAQELRRNYHPVEIIFICRTHEGHLADLIKRKAFIVYLLQPPNERFVPRSYPDHAAWLGASQDEDAEQTYHVIKSHINEKIDWLVVDHYGIESGWHKKLRSLTQKIMVIDDLADRNLDCDLLLNQNFGADCRHYEKKINANCHTLMGTQYTLLRPEFAVLREKTLARRREITIPERLLIALGGTDPDNVTGKILQALDLSVWKRTDVILAVTAPHLKQVKDICENFTNISVHVSTDNMAELMSCTDLAFGAAGTSTWERCALGLPTLLVINAENQKMTARQLDKNKAIILLGPFNNINAKIIRTGMNNILNCKKKYAALVSACSQICDGSGTFLVAKKMAN